jgi:F0F1-type ATP synthase delta subunit
MSKAKEFVVSIMILLQAFSASAVAVGESAKEPEDALSKAMKSFATELKPFLHSMYIVIDNNKNIYLHDSSTFARLMFDENKKISLEQMNKKVKEFAHKKDKPNLRAVFLVVEENTPFKYLYEVIRCYESAVYDSIGSNIVEYRFSSPLTEKLIKTRIKENEKYPASPDHDK